MKKCIMLLIGFTLTRICSAQYPALFIADSLTKGTHTVVRLNETTYEIKSPGKAKTHKHSVKTILNEDGVRFGIVGAAYDKFTDINYIDAKLYDAFGKELKKVKTKDMHDESGSSEETLMTDRRYKVYDFEYRNYPYTVETDEEDDIDGILDINDWMPQPSPGVSVEVSRFIVITPKDYVLRYKSFNINIQPVIANEADKKIYTWEIKNIPAKKQEVLGPEWREIAPFVMMAPSIFEAQGYTGDMSTWQGYGKFLYELMKGRDILPDEVKKKVHDLTDGLTSTKERVYVLYDYLQKNTRYISIQLGIGGLQPFDASFVAAKKYGDCKALSNYMLALLKEAGIKANCLSIDAGEDAQDVVTEFPCHQFNHRITCVPLDQDTIWLECTSQTLPPGYMGSFTGNRKALLIDESGGYIVNTKRYAAKDNVDVTNLIGEIDENGNLTADISTRYMGYGYFDVHARAAYRTKEEQLEKLKEKINLATYDVRNFSYDDHKSDNPYIDENVKVVGEGCASVSGKRLFFAPNFLSQIGVRLQSSDSRKFDVVYKNNFRNIDSLKFKLPAGYSVEAMAKDVVINNKFGIYEIHFKVDGDNVLVTRLYERQSARFPPSEYNNLVKFYDDMYKADRSKIVFVKKDS